MSYMVLKLLPDYIAVRQFNRDATFEGDDGGEGIFDSYELAMDILFHDPRMWGDGNFAVVEIKAEHTQNCVDGEKHAARYDIKESQRHACIVALRNYIGRLKAERRAPEATYKQHNAELDVLVADAMGAHEMFVKAGAGFERGPVPDTDTNRVPDTGGFD